MSKEVYIAQPKRCDLCNDGTIAKFDARLTLGAYAGQWANVCADHFESYTSGKLGTGVGQRLIVGEAPEVDPTEKRAEIMAAIESGDFDTAEELIGDGDFFEYL